MVDAFDDFPTYSDPQLDKAMALIKKGANPNATSTQYALLADDKNPEVRKAVSQFRNRFEKFNPKRSLLSNIKDSIIPGVNTPLGILSPIISNMLPTQTGKLALTLGNYVAGQMPEIIEFVGNKISRAETPTQPVVPEQPSYEERMKNVQDLINQAMVTNQIVAPQVGIMENVKPSADIFDISIKN